MNNLIKRAITALLGLATLISVFALVACQKDKYEDKMIDTYELSKSMAAVAGFQDTLAKTEKSVIAAKYPSFNKAISAVIWTGSGATAEEIIILEFNDSKTAKEFKENNMDSYLADKKTTFESYNAAEMPKLENAVNRAIGKYVIYCVSPNYDKVNEVIETEFNK